MAKMEIDEIKQKTNELVAKYNLDMKVVGVEYAEDRKVIITYICDDRVDFRELVKDLASAIHYRIELKQIGVRDHAKRVGGIGICGKECCCKQYLNNFDKVSVKMAKTQGLSLNPTKISGVCGRLMCCLSFEDQYYQEMVSKMPKINTSVSTPDGVGVVVYLDFMHAKISVKFVNDGDSKVVEYTIDETTPVDKKLVDKQRNVPQNDKKVQVVDKKSENNEQHKNESKGVSGQSQKIESEKTDKNKKHKFNKKHKKPFVKDNAGA